jgi:hypothetical protein
MTINNNIEQKAVENFQEKRKNGRPAQWIADWLSPVADGGSP